MVSQQCHCLSTGLKPGVNERDFWGKALIDQEVADRWGLLTAAARNGGIVLPVIDGLLAATALGAQSYLGYERYRPDSIDGRSSFQSVGTKLRPAMINTANRCD